MLDKTINLKFIDNLEAALMDKPGVFKDIQTLFSLPKDIQPQDSIETLKFIHLLQCIQQDHGIEDIAYRLGQYYTPTQMGVLGLYLQTCNTLKDALHHYLEYSYLDNEFDNPLQLTMHENTFIISSNAPAELLGIKYTYNAIKANRIIKSIQFFCGPDVLPLSITTNTLQNKNEFPKNIKINLHSHEKISVTYKNSLLSRNLPGRDSALNKLLKHEVDKKILKIRGCDNLVSAVIQYIMAHDNLSTINLTMIARSLSMSERTLSRKLKNENIQLKNIISHAKRQHAVRLLSEGKEVEDVSMDLGFSDRSSFERAFKSWTAFSPAKFKEYNLSLKNLAQQNSITHSNSLPAISQVSTYTDHPKNINMTIKQDPILTAKIFGLTHLVYLNAFKTSSISQALEKLHESAITRGMCHTIINNSAINTTSFKEIDLQDHWDEAHIIATFCKNIIKEDLFPNNWNESEIYILGFTCYIGLIFLLHSQKDNMGEVFSNYDLADFKSLSFSKAIEKHCGVSAFKASALIMTHWGYPTKYIQLLLDLETEKVTPSNQHLVNLLRCADEVAFYGTKKNEGRIMESLQNISSDSKISLTALNSVLDQLMNSK